MRPRFPVFTMALCLTTALFACQDQSALGPDGLAPLFAVDCNEKPNHPQCADTPPDGEVASVLFTSGFNPGENGWTWMDWDNGNDPGSILDLYSRNRFETNLDLSDDWIGTVPPTTPTDGVYGPCIYEPAATDTTIIKALAKLLDGFIVPEDTPEDSLRITRINVDLGALPGTSIENFLRFFFYSYDPDLMSIDKRGKYKGIPQPGDIGFQVGGYWNHFDYPYVTVVEDPVTGEQTFTFTGGTVSVAKRGGVEPRLQCPLEDVVVVKVMMN